MAACLDMGYKKILRRPLASTTNNSPSSITPKGYFHAVPRASGFYELFDTREKSFKPSSRHIDGNYGYEKIWRPTRAKVEGAGMSSLGSNLTSRQPEQWRPSIKYIDPGTGTRIYDQPWRPGKKYLKAKDQLVDGEVRCTRKKFIMAEKHPNGLEWPSPRAPGTCVPRPEWEPPFRKGNKDDLQPSKHPRRHLNTYRDEYESSGVKNTLDTKLAPLPVAGKRRLPTYRNEQLSFGVGAAMQFPDYHPVIIL
ncbi:hypothetical protein L7F22_002574 [Adiantum nelumboides]|nr:hypothetical protein [Adiantum nelumboides]